jgi:lipopolysaccharide biosynthesis glycosyltransferase
MFTIDNNYVIPLAVAIKSMLDNFPKDRELEIIVADVGILEENRVKLSEIYPIRFEKLNIDRVRNIKINIVYHTSAIFARLFMPEVLYNLNKILYFDPDIIIKEDISKLWDMNVSNYVLAAAQDDTIPERENYIYFNSGVMLMNLDKWRKENISEKAIEYVSKNITNHTDQDALNDILKGNYLRFSKKWNSNPISGRRDGLKIMHFLGSEKPWWYNSKMDVVPIFFEILDKTPFKGWRPEIPKNEIEII